MADYQVTTTSDAAPPITFRYLSDWLKEAAKYIPHLQFADMIPFERGMGNQIKMRRYPNLDATPFTLAEGITPAGKRLQKYDIYATVQWFGDFIGLSDELIFGSADAVKDVGQFLLGRQAGQMWDQVARDIYNAGTHAIYTSNETGGLQTTGRTAVNGRVNAAALDKLARALRLNDARPWTEKIMAGTGVGSEPIPECWPVITHERVLYDLKRQLGDDYQESHKYPRDVAFAGEDGRYGPFRFIRGTQAKSWADGSTASGASTSTYYSTAASYPDVFSLVAIGKDAVGAVSMLDGTDEDTASTPVEMIFKQLGSGGTEDPLNQRSTVGWKAPQVVKIKDQTQLYRLEVLASA